MQGSSCRVSLVGGRRLWRSYSRLYASIHGINLYNNVLHNGSVCTHDVTLRSKHNLVQPVDLPRRWKCYLSGCTIQVWIGLPPAYRASLPPKASDN